MQRKPNLASVRASEQFEDGLALRLYQNNSVLSVLPW